MSTRLLSSPEKAHELRDDLESLWFVFLYEALHFVKHNEPFGINMNMLFNQIDECSKTEFRNRPFTALARQVYQLFQTLHIYDMEFDNELNPKSSIVKSVRKLDSCAEIERLFREALKSQGWPENRDKVEDQYPPVTEEREDTVALSHVDNPLREPSKPYGMKWKREEEYPRYSRTNE